MEDEVSRYDDEPKLSLNDFKKWMARQPDKPVPPAVRLAKELIGTYVESKLGVKRLINQMTAESGEPQELAKDFRRYGGVVVQVDRDHNFLIEVESGTFSLPKYFVRRR
jgi:hypothetical protein